MWSTFGLVVVESWLTVGFSLTKLEFGDMVDIWRTCYLIKTEYTPRTNNMHRFIYTCYLNPI